MVQAQFYFITNSGTITITAYTGSGGVVVIPSTTNGLPVTSIGDSAFAYRGVTSITIPGSVTSIGSAAFNRCTALTTAMISPGVTSIGVYAFSECASLTNVTIPDGLSTIDDSAFYFCTSLPTVTVPSSVTRIGRYAFYGCDSLTAITVNTPNSAYSSAEGVLLNQSQTTLIQFPGGKAGSYTLPSSVTDIGAYSFAGNAHLTSVTIPNTVTNFGQSAFAESKRLASVTVLNGVTRIGTEAFLRCTSLTNATLPGSVAIIGGDAFASTSLTNVDLPTGVIYIGNGAFLCCHSLTNVSIPSTVSGIGAQALDCCDNLTTITVDASNPFYSSVAGALFIKDRTRLIKYPAGRAGGYTVPNGVKVIEGLAFDGCAGLTSVVLPSSLITIEDYNFYNSASLAGLYFKGEPPTADFLFGAYSAPVVYYLPGTTNWHSTFCNRPTMLWNPVVKNADGKFGLTHNQFGFTITGTSNLPIVVAFCTNVTHPTWLPLQTCTLTNGSIHFSDPDWTNYPTRLYRIRSP
jgi:hypothetical protein